IHDSPELTVNVIRSSIDLATTMSEIEAEKLLTSTERTINRMLNEYSTASDLTEQLTVIKARILNLKNKKEEAEALMEKSVKVKIVPAFEDNLDKIKAFHEVGLWENSMTLLDQLKTDFKHDSFTGKVLSEYLEQESKERQSVRYTPKELGEMASAHYKNRRYKPAYNLLCQAFQLTPTNANIALSLLKVLVKLAEAIDLTEEEEQQVHNCIKMLDNEELKKNQLKNFTGYKKSIYELGIIEKEA
ncbi:MAG: response regulator, partial [Paraglaciecola sp.]